MLPKSIKEPLVIRDDRVKDDYGKQDVAMYDGGEGDVIELTDAQKNELTEAQKNNRCCELFEKKRGDQFFYKNQYIKHSKYEIDDEDLGNIMEEDDPSQELINDFFEEENNK